MAPPGSSDLSAPPEGRLGAPPWPGLRRLVLFVLGVAVIVNGIATQGQNVGQLVIGVILVGVVPLDELLGRLGRRWRPRDDAGE
jgi:hypothetical protein